MKKGMIFATFVLVSSLLVGCAAEKRQMEPIPIETAKAAALEASGYKATDVDFTAASLNVRNGVQYYGIDFTADGVNYAYDVDALTGKVISHNGKVDEKTEPSTEQNQAITSAEQSQTTPSTEQSNNLIGENKTATSDSKITAEKAKQIALDQVPGAKEQDIREFEVDHDDGRLEYEGKIYYDHKEYEFEIDGYSGAIRNWEVESIFD